jgi:hypothetical protein
MAVLCSNCGNQNPDGTAFCVRCGSALASVTPSAAPAVPAGALAPAIPGVAPAPAAGTPPPPPPLPSTPPAARAVRLSRNAIIGIAVAVIAVVAGGVLAFAAIHKPGPTPGPAPVNPVTVPTLAPTAPPVSRLTPAPSRAPVPTSPSGPATSGGGGNLGKIVLPAGFVDGGVKTESGCPQTFDGMDQPQGSGTGVLFYGVCDLPAGTTNAAFDQMLLQADKQSLDPNTALCQGGPNGPSKYSLNGSGGALPSDVFTDCYTETSQNGPALQRVGLYFAAVGKRSDGSLAGVFIEFIETQGEADWTTNLIPDPVLSQTSFDGVSP